MSLKEPVFIVGAPRSGTTLLAAMLNAHSQMSCGPETHFFRWLSNTDPALLEADWPVAAERFIDSITHTNFTGEGRTPLIEKYHLSPEAIHNYLVQQPPSIRAILSAVTAQSAEGKHKTRWIEKTPDHIWQVELIRKYFPQSPIVRIMRDPRDVALSLTKVPWGAETVMYALISWKQIDVASNPFFSQDAQCYTLRFEDLLMQPTQTLQKLCAFLGENFEESMLDTTSSGRELNSRNVAWKSKASQPLDPSRIGVWRTELSPRQKTLAEALIGDRLQAYGYALDEPLDEVGELFPGYEYAPKYEIELEALPNQHIRFWKQHANEKATAKVYLGDPCCEHWFEGNRIGCLIKTASLAARIIDDRLSRKTIYWILKEEQDAWSGYAAGLLKWLLSPFKISIPTNSSTEL